MTVLVPTAFGADGFGIYTPRKIIDYKQIQQAVIIDVHPSATHAPQGAVLGVGLRNAGLCGNICERSIAIVVIQSIAVHSANEDILESVVIVIADGDGGVVSRSREAGFR